MLIHTNVFSFDPALTEEDKDQFFTEMRQVVDESGLAKSFERHDHIALPPMDEHSPVFTTSSIVQIAVSDLNAVGTLAVSEPLQDFIGRWQARSPYKVVWFTTEA
jgi:hypothetical protein